MAKRYGGRWQIVDGPTLGAGGQSRVYRVRDLRGEHSGEFALKHVHSRLRSERFRREIEAIKRLTDPPAGEGHPNVIKLIDHSALDADAAAPDKQFLVMPIAAAGDLSDRGRISLYKNSIDAVVQVSKQLASALAAAHAAAIIHRDVKPQNILFPGHGHDLWLSDFGICLLRDAPRVTEAPEIVGPRNFMAPELEFGEKLDVTPAADLYSLGKVIYYMLSGGVVLPRERLNEDQFRSVFAGGQRYQLLELLLDKMICPVSQRIQTAEAFVAELEKIENWEQSALTVPMSAVALKRLEGIQKASLEAGRVAAENRDARQREHQTQSAIHASVTDWLTAELGKIAAMLSSGVIKGEVRPAVIRANLPLRLQVGSNPRLKPLNGVELVFDDPHEADGRVHVLSCYFCEYRPSTIAIETADRSRREQPQPSRDLEFGIVATYCQTLRHSFQSPDTFGFVSKRKLVGSTRTYPIVTGRRMRSNPPQMRHHQLGPVELAFEEGVAHYMTFRASQWPSIEDALRKFIEEALDVFLLQIEGS